MIVTIGASGSAVNSAIFKSFDSSGFTVTWAQGTTIGLIVHYLALGGSDITNATLKEHSSPLSAQQVSYTGVGFQPDISFFLTAGLSNVDAGNGTLDGGFGVAMSSTKRWTVGWGAYNGANMSSSARNKKKHLTNECLTALTASGADYLNADLVQMDSDGYTVNWTTVQSSPQLFAVLSLKGGNYDLGSFAKSVTTPGPADDSVSGLSFQPSAVLLESFGIAATTSISADAEASLGAASAVGAAGGIWFENVDGVLPSVAKSKSDLTKILSLNSGPATLNAESDLKSFDSNGFTITWTTNNAVAAQILWTAFGPTTATPSRNNRLVVIN
jgi:hypothetical protein